MCPTHSQPTPRPGAGERLTARKLAAIFAAYVQFGSIAKAARSHNVHPKTAAKYSRREQWPERRARILREAAKHVDEILVTDLATAAAAARQSWTEMLEDANVREAMLRLLRERQSQGG